MATLSTVALVGPGTGTLVSVASNLASATRETLSAVTETAGRAHVSTLPTVIGVRLRRHAFPGALDLGRVANTAPLFADMIVSALVVGLAAVLVV